MFRRNAFYLSLILVISCAELISNLGDFLC
jgi:hypothetical protein